MPEGVDSDLRDEDITAQLETWLGTQPEFSDEADPKRRPTKESRSTSDEPAQRPRLRAAPAPDPDAEPDPDELADDPDGDREKEAAEGDGADEAGISNLSGLAQAFEVEESALLEAIRVPGANGEEIPLGEALNQWRTRPTPEQFRADNEASVVALRTKLQTEHDQRILEVQRLTQSLFSALGEERVDWAKLRQEDPQEFAVKWAEHQQKRAQMGDAFNYLEREARAREATNERDRQEWASKEFETLLTKRPEWRDEGKRNTAAASIRKTLQEIGFTHDEILGLTDHRHILTAWKAAEYDRLTAKQKQLPQKKLIQLPNVALRAGARREPSQARSAQRTKLFGLLKRTGDDRVAAKLLEDFV